ncbi:MAG TPA: NAD+ synthase [Candidatus Micrarchaeota archaeon]|nr:NAD+ synthase [Candidatus Micrarchaeota archaeon]
MQGITFKPSQRRIAMAERKIISFIRAYFKKAGEKTAIVGLSGGLDSAATLALCSRALGKGNVVAVLMPSSSTPADDLKDAKAFAKQAGAIAISFPIERIIRSFGYLAGTRIGRANISARVRMASLYAMARRHGCLVVGTGDKSEFLLGYFTKYGDGGADLFPIGGLYKTEVRALGARLGVPARILEKPPSPALWKGQTAEAELGVSYAVADAVLSRMEKGASRGLLSRAYGKAAVSKIISRMGKNRHKLAPAPICKI